MIHQLFKSLLLLAILPSLLLAGPEEDAYIADLQAVDAQQASDIDAAVQLISVAKERARIARMAAKDRYEQSFVPPTVSYSFDATSISEGESAVLTATLSKPWKEDFRVHLQFGGTTSISDYNPSAVEVVIPKGETTGSITVSAIDDPDIEDDEILSIGSVSLTIKSDDVPPPPPPDPDPVPDPIPEPEPAFPPVLKARPRFWHNDIRPQLIAAPNTLKYVAQIADTDATTRLVDTPFCCAALWRISQEGGLPTLPPRSKYLYTPEQYRDRAINKAIALAGTQINLAGNHYATNHLHPLALIYDWLHDDMTPEQRAPIRDCLAESLTAAYTLKRFDKDGKPLQVQNPNLYWGGYNADSGSGMTVALAVHGETDVDWVRKYWDENWWAIPPPSAKGIGGLYNRQYERDWLVGGGNNEDWGYFPNQLNIRVARYAWENATGDLKSLDYPFLSCNSLLYLHQSVPLQTATGRRLKLMPTYGNGNDFVKLEAFWFAAGTGSSDPQIAALSAWLLPQVQYATQGAADEFFWRCVVGDPRVKPQSPAELGLPMDYYAPSSGLYYDRTGWDDNATRVFFGCSEQMYRSTAAGNVMIWSGGRPLIADRSGSYSHGYSGYGRSCMPEIRVEATGKVVSPLGGDGTPRRVKVASFTRDGNRYTADLTKIYPSSVTRMIRSFEFDREAGVVTITDECIPKPGFVPMAAWPTPLRPTIVDEAPLLKAVFSNGTALGEMTWDAPPADIAVRGGETDNLWAEDYDRTLYFPERTTEWQKLPRDQQILAGGFYTVYVTPAKGDDGVYRQTTTIKVGP